jgi:hypothetical protein
VCIVWDSQRPLAHLAQPLYPSAKSVYAIICEGVTIPKLGRTARIQSTSGESTLIPQIMINQTTGSKNGNYRRARSYAANTKPTLPFLLKRQKEPFRSKTRGKTHEQGKEMDSKPLLGSMAATPMGNRGYSSTQTSRTCSWSCTASLRR